MEAVLVKNANRMMTVASLLEDGIELSFADGSKGLIPYADVPEIRERAAVSGLELPNPYEMVVETAHGEKVEIPWDFARHYCDASYRPTIEAIAMRGKADRWIAHQAVQGVRRIDAGRPRSRGGHRARDTGPAGKGRTDAQIQDP